VTDHGVQGPDLERLTTRREQLAAQYLKPRDERPEPTARGVHHVALICADVERTIRFYDGLLGFPLIEMFENRDYRGSTHFFFDVGAGNTLAFFDLPGVEIGPYAEVLGGLQHLAISISQEQWEAARARLDAAGIPYQHISGTSLYFLGPDGERLELLADPLRWMYGKSVG
jgi:catechol 2,3-dioxygenase-like lactoylglutathione lyase family enzyme